MNKNELELLKNKWLKLGKQSLHETTPTEWRKYQELTEILHHEYDTAKKEGA